MPLVQQYSLNNAITSEGESFFETAYRGFVVQNTFIPSVLVPKQYIEGFTELISLKRRAWNQEQSWLVSRDTVGILGSLVIKRYLNIPVSQALEDFKGDIFGRRAGDLTLGNGLTVDIKTSGQKPKYKFRLSKDNGYPTDLIVFVRKVETAKGYLFQILGFTTWERLCPFLSNGDKYRYVTFNRLLEAGVVEHIDNLYVTNKKI